MPAKKQAASTPSTGSNESMEGLQRRPKMSQNQKHTVRSHHRGVKASMSSTRLNKLRGMTPLHLATSPSVSTSPSAPAVAKFRRSKSTDSILLNGGRQQRRLSRSTGERKPIIQLDRDESDDENGSYEDTDEDVLVQHRSDPVTPRTGPAGGQDSEQVSSKSSPSLNALMRNSEADEEVRKFMPHMSALAPAPPQLSHETVVSVSSDLADNHEVCDHCSRISFAT
jgi:hypothetical protein